MSIEEYTEAHAAYSRRLNWLLASSFVLGAGSLVLVSRNMDFIWESYFRQFEKVTAEWMVSGAIFLPWLVFLFGGIFILERRKRRDPRLSCPYCKKDISMCRALVVATRNCPSCGKRVVDEPA